MKQVIKRMMPNSAALAARRIYRGIFKRQSKPGFSKKQYDSLTALKCMVSYNKYGGYCIPESSRNRPAAQKILSNDVYEPNTIEFMIANCGGGDIVHAGTYFGDFLPALSKACTPDSKVWAFEPNYENYRCANITLLINDIKNVVLTNAGVGEKTERLLMKISDEMGRALGGSSKIIDANSEDIQGTEAVQLVRIDDAIDRERAVSLVQLDVEGHEKAALNGALETIKRFHPILILEVLPNSALLESDWFSKNILSLGYQNTCNVHGNSVFVHQSQNRATP